MVNFKPRPLYHRAKTPVSTHYVGRWVGPRATLDDFKRKICLCWDLKPVASDYTNYAKKAVKACYLVLCRCSSGGTREKHANLSTVNVVDIPSGSDGYRSLETVVNITSVLLLCNFWHRSFTLNSNKSQT
jgi:hypothetical protein